MKTNQILYYSQHAGEYEKIYDLPERQKDLAKIKIFLKENFANRDVFEIACGTGYFTKIISKSAQSVFATDINEPVLDIALSKKYSCLVNLQATNMFDLSVIRSSYNSGFTGFIWSHILKQDLSHFLDQFLSKINKNGLAVFVDNTFVKGSSTPVIGIDEYENSFQERILNSGESYTIVKNYPADSEINALIDPVGENIKIVRLNYYWILTFNKK